MTKFRSIYSNKSEELELSDKAIKHSDSIAGRVGVIGSTITPKEILKGQIHRKEAELSSLKVLIEVIRWDNMSDKDESRLSSYLLRSE